MQPEGLDLELRRLRMSAAAPARGFRRPTCEGPISDFIGEDPTMIKGEKA
jgi:hypothetical protein